MAAKYCPRWLFNLCASMTAYEFIIGDMPIKSYANKFSGGLSEHYGEIKHEEIESTAEVMLRFLVEINAENSDELLNAFVYFNLKYHSDGSKRKIKGIFGSAFDAEKEIKFLAVLMSELKEKLLHKDLSIWAIILNSIGVLPILLIMSQEIIKHLNGLVFNSVVRLIHGVLHTLDEK